MPSLLRLSIVPSVLISLNLGSTATAGPLKDATLEGDVAAVATLLDSGLDPDEKGVATPLYFAAQRGHYEVAALLVAKGADVNAEGKFGTPLQIAARGNRREIVELLLDNGADPNLAGGEKGHTPLHDAAESGARESALLLIDHGAEVDRRTKSDHPPIHLAARKGKADMVALLREQGAASRSVDPLSAGEIAEADLELGRIRAIECEQCHALEIGDTPPGRYPGPDLWNVLGREKGSFPEYAYSQAMRSQTGSWTYDELNRFLADPTGNVPGTNMGVGHEPDRAKRIAVIAYLRTLSDDPVPLP